MPHCGSLLVQRGSSAMGESVLPKDAD